DPTTGKFRAKTDEEKAAEAAAAEAAAAAKKPEGEKKPEADDAKTKAVNDPIPENTPARTRERIQTLINTVKETDQTLGNYRELIQSISDTGVNESEFAEMLGYQRLVHSDNPEHLNIAYQVLQRELRGLSLRLNKDFPEVDFLADYQDLRDQV